MKRRGEHRQAAVELLEVRAMLAAGFSFDFTTYAGAHDPNETVHGGPAPQTSPNTIIYYGFGSVTSLTDMPNTLTATGGTPSNLTFEFGSSNAASFEEVVSLNVFDDGVADGTANQNYVPNGALEVGGTKTDNAEFRVFNSGVLVATGDVVSIDLEVSPSFVTTSSQSVLQLDSSAPVGADPAIYNELVAISSGASGLIPFSLGPFSHEGIPSGFTNVQEFSSVGQSTFPVPAGLSAILVGGDLSILDSDVSGRANNLTVDVVNGGNDLQVTAVNEKFDAAPAGAVLSAGDSVLTVPLASVTGVLSIQSAGGDDVINVGALPSGFTPSLELDGGAGADSITFSAGINVNGAVNLAAETVATSNLVTNGGNVSITTDSLVFPFDVTTNGGDIDFIVSGSLDIQGSPDAGSGDVSILADNLTLTSVAGNGVTLRPFTTSTDISLGGADGVGLLGISASDLAAVTANRLSIGDASTGNIVVDQAIDLSTVPIVHLRNSGDVTLANGAGLVADQLAVSAQGVVRLTQGSFDDPSTVDIGVLAIETTDTITVRDVNGLTIGAVDALTGVTTTTGSISLFATGAMTVNEAVSTGNGFAGLYVRADDKLLDVKAAVSGTSQVLLQSDKIAVSAPLSAPGGTVYFLPEDTEDDHDAIHVGSGTDAATDTLELSLAELEFAVARNLRIGNNSGDSSGQITIDAAVAPSTITHDVYISNSGAAHGIDFTTNGSVTAPNHIGLATTGPVTTDTTLTDLTSNSVHVSSPGVSVGSATNPLRIASDSFSTLNAFNAQLFIHEQDTTNIGTFGLQGANSTVHLQSGTFQMTTSTVNLDVVVGPNAVLKGTGITQGMVTVSSGGTLAPGSSPGQITTGDLLLNSGSDLSVEIDGLTPRTQYDQIVVNGAVSLEGATLTVVSSFSPPPGAAFVLIDNDGTDEVTGTFDGLAEGALIDIGGDSLSVSYEGGSGNDVTLTPISAITGVKFEDLNANGVRDTGEPGLVGWTIFADSNGNRLLDTGELSDTTDGTGTYTITGVPAGAVDIVEVQQNGWTASLPASVSGALVEPSPPVLPRTGVANTTVSTDVAATTTWTKANGPYLVTTPIDVKPGVTLTIEPGVEVLFATGAQLVILGTLNAIGSAAEPILFTSSAAIPAPSDWSGIYVYNTANAEANLQFVTVEYANTAIYANSVLTLADSILRHSTTGLYGNASTRTEVDRTVFDNNMRGLAWARHNVRDSLFTNNDYGIFEGIQADVSGSVFRANTVGLNGARDLVIRNSKIQSNATGVQQYFNAGPSLYSNEITGNGIGAILGSGRNDPFTLEGNSFHGNTTLNLQTLGANDKDVPGNYWGATTNPAIDASIEDARDIISRGLVNYEPILTTAPDIAPAVAGHFTVTVQVGVTVSNIDFGNYRTATISGTKFDDLNGDGTKDTGDPELQGFTIYIDANANGQLDNNEFRTSSASNGTYSFADLKPGIYRLREVGQTGWTNTLPAAGFIDVTVVSGQTVPDVDFGNHEPGRPDPAEIHGVKFDDLDGDGIKDPGEPGLSGWTIFLDTNGNRTRDSFEPTTTTGGDGSYSFTNLHPGTWIVGEVPQVAWQQSFPELLTPVPPAAPATVTIDHSTITAATTVGGGIFQDTTWRLADSPVRVNGTVAVFPGAALTIEPGVVVLFDAGTRLDIRGALIVAGTETEPVLLTSSSTTPAKNDWSGISVNNNVGGTASLAFTTVEYASSAVSISDNNSKAMEITDSTFRDNTTAISHSSVSRYVVARSLFDNNTTALRAGDMHVIDSIFTNNTTGLAETFRMTVENSLFSGNVTAVRGYSDTVIRYSTITGNTIGVQEANSFGGARVENSTITGNDIGFQTTHVRNLIATGNNIFDNTIINVDNQTNKDHDFTNNYWGTQSAAEIAASITDQTDNGALGIVNVNPYALVEQDISAPEAGSHTVAVTSGEIVNDINFGNFQKLSASFLAATAAVDEDAGIIVIEAQLAAALPFDTSVPITFTGTAVLNQDYAVTDGTLFFPAGTTAGTMTLTINDDARFEGADTIVMAIESGVGVVAGSTPTQTISINDNDPIPGLSFFTAGTIADESVGSVLLEARLTAESEVDVEVPVLFSGTATEGSDYSAGASPIITIPAGALRGSLTVSILDDPTGEPAERIVWDFGTPTGAVLSTNVGDPLTHVITIPQNDAPNVSFTASQGSFAENGGTRDITVRLSNATATDVIVPFTVSHGTNANTSDYDISPTSSLIITAGQTEGVITLTGQNDNVDESNERITVHMGTPTGAVPGTIRAFTGTIIDDDRAYVRFTSSGKTVWENQGAQTVTLQLTRPSTSNVTVFLSQSGSARSAGFSQDYEISRTSFTFVPGGPTTQTFTVDPRGDSTTEKTEYGYVKIASANGATVDSRRNSYRLAIRDDDPYVYMSRGGNIRESGTTSTTISIYLTASSNRTITVPVYYRGSAYRNRDYTGPSSVTFSPGQTRKTITIKAKNDSFDEYTESIRVYLGSPTNAKTTSSLRRSTSFKIYDNDASPTVYFTSSRQYLNEGETAYVTVKLTRYSAKTIWVPIRLSKYTTAESNDHTFRNLTLKFTPGQTSKTIAIRTHNDSRREPYDKIQLYISSSLTNAKRPRGGTPYHRAYIRPSDGYGNTPVSSSKSQTGSLAISNGPSNIGNIDASQLGIPGVDLSKFGTASTNAVPGTLAIDSGGGYLVGSTAFFDANFNGIVDFLDLNGNEIQDEGEPSEPVAITGADGRFELTIDPVFDQDGSEIIEVTEGRFVVTGGTDGATLLPFVGQFSAVPGQFLVSSVSSTVQQLTALGLASVDANLRVIEAFDMPDGLDLATLDLIDATVNGSNDAAVAFARSAEVFNTTVATASLFSGTVGAPTKSLLVDLTYAEIASRILVAESTMDLSDAATVSSLIEGISFRTGIVLSTDIVDGAGTLIANGNLAIRDLTVTTDLPFVQQIVRVETVMQGVISDDLTAVAAGTKNIADVLSTYAGSALDTAITAATIGDVIKPAIVVNDVVQTEGDNGDTTFDFVVSLLTPSIYPVSVQYETVGDSADEEDGDFTSAAGTLNWAVGETGDRTVSVTVTGDTTSESDERFLLSLFNEKNAVLQRNAGTAFILNDDVLQHSATQMDGETSNEFTLQLSEDQVILLEDDDEAFDGYQTQPWVAVLQGQDDVDDTLFLDFGADSYRSDTITFDGGGGTGFDTAVVSGGQFDTVTVSLSNATDGQTVFDPADSDEIVTLNWMGLEPFVFDTVVADMMFELPAGVTSAVLEDYDATDATNPEVMRLYSPNGDFEDQIFPNPSGSLTIRGGAGADTITIASLDPAFTANLIIDGDFSGSDAVAVSVDGAIDIPPLLHVQATSFDVNAAITDIAEVGELRVDAVTSTLNADVEVENVVVAGGTLLVGASSLFADLTVDAGGTLGGTGIVDGFVFVNAGGHVDPGAVIPGLIEITSPLSFASTSSFDVDLNGTTTPGTDFDQLRTTGPLTIDAADLNVTLGYTPSPGESFVIVNNQSGSPIAGTLFNGLPDESVFVVSGTVFRIDYEGGTGDDVELTVVAPVTVTGTTPSLDNGVLTAGTTELTIDFSRDVDASAGTAPFTLQSVGPDGLLGSADNPGDDDVVSITSATYNGDSVTLAFAALPESVYRLGIDDSLTGVAGDAIDGDGDGIASGDSRSDFVVGALSHTLTSPSPNSFDFDVEFGGFGAAQLVQGTNNAFDGLNRLQVGGTPIAPDSATSNSVTVTEVGQTSSGLIPSSPTLVPGLTTTITLSETKSVRLSATVPVTINGITGGNAYVGIRFEVDGNLIGSNYRWFGISNFGADKFDALNIEDYLTLGPGAHTIRVFSNASGSAEYYSQSDAELRVAEFNAIGPSTAVTVTEVGQTSSGSIPSSPTLVPGLTTTITLSETKSVRLSATVPVTINGITGGNAYVGIRFEVDGNLIGSNYRWFGISNFGADKFDALNIEDYLTLGPGAHTIRVFSNASGSAEYYSQSDAELRVAEFNSIGPSTAVTVTEVGQTSSGSIPSSPTLVPGLTTTITLSETKSVRLSATVPVTINGITGGNAYVGIRFEVDGNLIGSNYRWFGISNFGADKFDALNIEDYLTLGPGAHTIRVFSNASGSAEYYSQSDAELRVAEFNSIATAALDDTNQTVVTSVNLVDGLDVHREITVPSTGSEDFARTIEVLQNSTGSAISTTVRIVGNLGSDGATEVFNTSSGDTIVGINDQWIGTDDADSTGGTPAIIHYVHGPGGLKPTAVEVIDDNIYWTYDVTVPAGETLRLATFTILADTRAEAESAAAALVTTTGFGGQAAAFLTTDELASLANFQFNSPPMAVDDAVSTDEETALVINVLADNGSGSDSDAENNIDAALTVNLTSPSGGTLTNHNDGTFTFDPSSEFDSLAVTESTNISFDYQIQDTFGEVDSATVSITVTGVNDDPTVNGAVSGGSTEDDASFSVDLLAGANDVDLSDVLNVDGLTLVSGDDSGVTISTNGLTIDPAVYGYLAVTESAVIEYSYNVIDGNGGSEPQTATITITGVNDDPTVSGAVSGGSTEDGPTFSVDLLTGANDADLSDVLNVDGLTLVSGDDSGVTIGTNGLTVDPAAYGYLAVTESAVIEYSYNVIDGNGGSVPQTATITITGVNDDPTVSGAVSGGSTEDDASFSVDLLTGANDADLSDILNVDGLTLVSGDDSGVTIGTNGLTVDPAAYGYLAATESAVIEYSYNVIDGNGGSVPQTATITITGVNDDPTVSGAVSRGSTEDDASFSVDLLTGANDADLSDVLNVDGLTLVSGDDSGVTIGTNGLTVDPAAYGYLAVTESAVIEYSYNVIDGNGGSVPQTATVTITGVNDDPTVSGAVSGGSIEDDASFSVDLLTGANDADLSDVLNVDGLTLVSGDDSGVTIGTNGLTVDPAAYGYLAVTESAVIEYSYNVIDGNGGSVPQTATITITGVNDDPTVSGAVSGGSTEDDASFSVDLLAGANDVDLSDVLNVDGLTLVSGDDSGVTIGTNGLTIDPAAYGYLAVTESAVIEYSYNVIDGNGGSVPQTATVTITGVNIAPTVGSTVSADALEADATFNVDLLAGASDLDLSDVLSVDGLTLISGDASGVAIGTNSLTIDASAYSYLALTESAVIEYSYNVIDGNGGAVPQTATITITGLTDELDLLTASGRVPGNVIAVEQGPGLALVPDANDNAVYIYTDTNGDIVIRGLAGTTVNGAPEAVLFSGDGGVPGTMRVFASAGTMLTAVNDLTVGALEIFGGAASEAVEMSNTNINGHLTINLTEGDNSLLFTNGSGAVARTTLQTGSGNDMVELNGATFGSVNNIDTGAGRDTVTLTQTEFSGSVSLTTGDGNDTITGNVVNAGGAMRVNAGANSDNINLQEWAAASYGIVEPGDGNDTATISNSDLNGLFFANLGSGNNTFMSTASTYQTSINVNTLPGNHDINFTGGHIFGATFINAFNGTSDVDVSGVTTSAIFVIRTAGTADTVDVIDSNFEDTLNISTNGGNDQVTITGTQVDKQVFLDTSLGRDNVSVTTTTVLQDLFVNTGNANDTIGLDQVSVTLQTNVEAGEGIDSTTIENSAFGTLTNINTGRGNDVLNVIGTTFSGNTSLNTDAGHDVLTAEDVQATAAFTIDTGTNNDVIDLSLFSPSQPLTIKPGSGNDAVRLMNFPTSGAINISPVSGNNVVDLQGNTFGNHVTIATADAHLAVRHRNNTFTTASFIAGTAATDDVFLEDGTSTFNSPPAVFNFDDLTNSLIDELFEDLLGLAFP